MVRGMVRRKDGKRRMPPSRQRYEASHPTITARVSRELYDELQRLRDTAGLSYADVLRVGLDKAKVDTGKAYLGGFDEGMEGGWELAQEQYEVTYFCSSCRRRHMTITTEGEKEAAAQLMYKANWHSPECAER